MFDVLQGSVQGDLASGGDGIPRVPSRDRQAFFYLFLHLIAGSLHEEDGVDVADDQRVSALQ